MKLMGRMTVLLLAVGAIGTGARAAELDIPRCQQSHPGKRVCVPVTLKTGGDHVASASFTVSYDTSALRLPGAAADVEAGSALTGGQRLAASVQEDINGGHGAVQVTITPAVKLPIPTISDGTLCKVCFTPPAGSRAGCGSATLGSVEVGSDTGHDLAATAAVTKN